MKDARDMTTAAGDTADTPMPVIDRRLKEQLLILMLLDSLRCDNDTKGNEAAAAETEAEGISLKLNDMQVDLSKQIMTITQRMCDNNMPDLCHGDEGVKPSSPDQSVTSSEQQLMGEKEAAEGDATATVEKKSRASAKKKRYRKNKAAAKRRKKIGRMSWLHGVGILPQIIMMALGSITTLIVCLTIIHQRVDGSSEGGAAAPALPPTTSKSLLRSPHRLLSTSKPDAINSPSAAVVLLSTQVSTSASVVSSGTPNDIQSSQPTVSISPSYSETPTPSSIQSLPPSQEPSVPGIPTSQPSSLESLISSSQPSSGPSAAPSSIPSRSPSSQPSQLPSSSAQPSVYPTSFPSSQPSSQPSFKPSQSMNPTEKPSQIPSESSAPSSNPIIKVTNVATGQSSSQYQVKQDCFDTPNWTDFKKKGCDWYEEDSGMDRCSINGTEWAGVLGTAKEHCCHCEGGVKVQTCEDYMSTCQAYFSVLGVKDGMPTKLCQEAEACYCGGNDHDVGIFTFPPFDYPMTVGLFNECKCDFWSRLCEETGGLACDYAAEYCCGDYGVLDKIYFVSSQSCFCDFFNYAQSFDHALKVKNLNKAEELLDPCSQLGFFSRVKYDNIGSGILENLLSLAKDMLKDVDDKVSLEALYNNTNGKDWINNAGWLDSTVSHCKWYGISCDSNEMIIGINLRNNNLVGQFPVYTRNDVKILGKQIPENFWLTSKFGLADLYYLKSLDLADNKLTGTIDYRPLYNLRDLTHFDVSGNQLSGSFDPLITPSVTYADFSNNSFTSMHRLQSYKVSSLQTLRSLDFSNNQIKINATDLFKHIPPNMEHFIASSNNIYGKLPPSLNNLSKLRRFGMSFNSLSGELPVFENSRFDLRELDLSNQENGFHGSITEEILKLQSLKILNLAGIQLTGFIPADIGNMIALERLDLSNNNLSGQIPSQIGQLEGADVHLKDNPFDINSITPLSLCTPVKIKASDLVDNKKLCPIERNALSKISVSAKGGEWTVDTNWHDEYASHCDWHGVKCNKNNKVTELNLRNNGLSGRLSSSIGHLTSLTKLDLSDNDIKGSIPTEIGLLTKLTYLRLSYNAFTGTAPGELLDLTNLQLLQLQSNRITSTTNISQLEINEKSIYGNARFVADCGMPSAFENALECEACTMCCNANEDCYPQDKSQIEELGYSPFAAILFASFTLICGIVVFFLSRSHEQKRSVSTTTLTISMEEQVKLEDDDYALSRVGKDSVYSYFVTDLCLGWLCAFVTLVAQAGILIFFVLASEANLQEDTTDIEFTWKCPLDTDGCVDKSDLEKEGWFVFFLLMATFLARDLINGFKLLYHSSKSRHTFWSRIRYFIGGLSLCIITLYALYVSTVYNSAIATSNTDIILNSVVVLFIMDMDEVIFAAIEAINEKWTAHVDESGDARSDAEEDGGGTSTTTLEEMKRDIASQDAKIAAQQDEIRRLRETMQQILESTAVAGVTPSEPIPQCAKNKCENVVSSPAIDEWQDNSTSMGNLYEDENNLNEEVQAIQTQHDGLSKPNFVEQEAEVEIEESH